MNKILLCSLVLLVLIPFVAAESPNVFLTFQDVSTGTPVSEIFVTIDDTNYFVEDSLKLRLPQGETTLSFILNDAGTQGVDFYGVTTFTVDTNTIETVRVFPAGSIQGFVKDAAGNTISNAQLKVECSSPIPLVAPSRADTFGSFSILAVPEGRCSITAKYKGNVGLKDIAIVKSQTSSVEIIVDQGLVGDTKSYVVWVLLGILVFGLIIYVLKRKGMKIHRKKKQLEAVHVEKKEQVVKKDEKSPDVKEEGKLGRRGKDLLRTLRDNERKIVKFLLEQDEPVYLSKIHHKTGISKGSLFRNLRSLGHKNIVDSFNEGRVRKVRLSEWFLEK